MPGNRVFYRRTQSVLKSEWEWAESMKSRMCVLGREEALDDRDVHLWNLLEISSLEKWAVAFIWDKLE